MRGMPSNLLPGEPLCSPRSMVLVESTVQLLRRLHRCDQWAPLINKYIHSQLELIGPLLKEDDLSHSNPGQNQLQQWSITGLQMRNYNKCLHFCSGFWFYVLAVLYLFHFINALSVVKTPSPRNYSKRMEYLILKNCCLFHAVFQPAAQATLRKKSVNERRTSPTPTEGNCIYTVDLCRTRS